MTECMNTTFRTPSPQPLLWSTIESRREDPGKSLLSRGVRAYRQRYSTAEGTKGVW
jgi:hypothetical protein